VNGKPHFGYTQLVHEGKRLAVHARTFDHLPSKTVVDRFNKRIGVGTTNRVGTMWCAYIFCVIALVSLPSTLVQAHVVPAGAFPSWMVAQGLIGLVQWVAQTFLQLVLLSVIIVGQNVQAAASDARAIKTFEDAERLLDLLDEHTEGGIKTVLDRLGSLEKLPDEVAALADASRAVLAARPTPKGRAS